MKKKNGIIGRKVIVRANVAGVHAGVIELYDPKNQSVTLTGAYRLWRYYTRDKSGSVSDIAANGLRQDSDNQIGARAPSTTINNPQGLELSEMTDAAYKSIVDWKNRE